MNIGNIASFIDVENGTYDVYAGKHSGAKTELIDTGLDIIINNNNSIGNVINYYSLQLVKGEGIDLVNNTGYTGAKTRYYLYTNSGTQQDIAIDATVSEGYNWDNWTKTSGPDLIAFDESIKSQNIKIGAGPTVLTANAKVDKPAPVANEIEVTNTLKQTKQTATISATDGVGINKYYWGTSSPTSSSTFTDVTSTTNFSTTKEITSAGTYYFAVKDTNGTMSVIKSVVIRSYAVQNLLEKVDGTTDTYTSGNYATSGSKTTYLAKNGTSITLADVYTIPTGSAAGKFKGYSTTFTTSAATVSTTAPTLNANTTYYMWFNRNTYELTLNKGTGIASVTGVGTYKYGKVVNIDATVSTGYTWEKWTKNSGNAPASTTNKSTTVTITQATTLTASATDETAPVVNEIEVTNTLKQTKQTATISATDGVGINKYYWGTSSPTSSSTFTDVTSTTNFSTTKEITSAGTYYFAVKDTNGTMSVIKSVVIRSYAVQNLLEKVDGTTDTYTSGNYATSGSKTTYLAKNGTSITLADVYTIPTGSAAGKFKGYSTTFTTSAATVSTTAPTLNANTTYYMWFNRNTYELTLNKGTGIASVTGVGTYKYGKVVNIDATVSTGYTWEKWTKNSGNAPASTTNKSTTVTITGVTTLTASATDKTEPIITVSTENATESGIKKITIIVSENGSGLSNNNSYQYYLSSSETELKEGSWTDYTSGEEFTIGDGITEIRYLFVKRVSDNAGNQSSISGILTNINNEQYHMFGRYNFETQINLDEIELQLERNEFTYTGNEIKPNIILKNENNVLNENQDYTVEFSNNINIGVATLTINGIGKYIGRIERKYIIIPAKLTGLVSSKQDSYSITLKWNEMNGVTGYEIYKYDETQNKYVNIKTVNGTSKKIKELSPKKSYKFKVRAFVTIGNKKYYGAFSDKMKFATGTKKTKIKKISSKNKKAIIQWNKVSGAKGYIYIWQQVKMENING